MDRRVPAMQPPEMCMVLSTVTLQQASGIITPMTICCTQTAQQLKQTVSRSMSIEVKLLELVYAGVIMLDKDELLQHEVCNGCTNDLLIEETHELTLSLKLLTGKSYPLYYKPCCG